MLAHLSLGTNDFARAREFYDAVLGALGYRRLISGAEEAGYGRDEPQFWIAPPLDETRSASAGNGTHVCFAADSAAAVEAFYEIALRQGGQDAGAPGWRPQYGSGYYGAFIVDPDGHKIEATFWDESRT